MSGEQQQYPDGDYIGLLPESFNLRAQRRQPADINPCALLSLRMRLGDQVDSLDLSQLFFFGRGFEEFKRTRIPEWMARVVLNVPNPWIPDLSLETLASPGTWTPTILPQQGAPFNVLPAVLDYREHVEQGRAIFGGRLFGTLGRAEFTLNFLSRPASSASQAVATARRDEAQAPSTT